MRRHISLLGLLILLTVGCSSQKALTTIQSAFDAPPNGYFTKILLFVPERNIIVRRAIENAVMGEFVTAYIADTSWSRPYYDGFTKTKPEIKSIKTTEYKWRMAEGIESNSQIIQSCSAIIPLWDELTPLELDSAVSKYEPDAVLIIAPQEYWTSYSYIPGFQIDQAYISRSGIDLSSVKVGSMTVETKNWLVESRLSGPKLVWKATSISTKGPFAEGLIESFAAKLCEQLQKDAMIPKRIITHKKMNIEKSH